MVGGDAVLERVRPTGVGGDVATDGAGRLAGGVGRKKKTMRRGLAGDPRVDTTSLHQCAPIADIDVEDSVHPGQGNHHPAVDGQDRPAEARPGTTRDDRQFQLVAYPDDLCDLLGRGWQHDGSRQIFLHRVGVALVDDQLAFAGDYGILADDRDQAVDHVFLQ